MFILGFPKGKLELRGYEMPFASTQEEIALGIVLVISLTMVTILDARGIFVFIRAFVSDKLRKHF